MPCGRRGRFWNLRLGQGGDGSGRKTIDVDRAGDVLDTLLAHVVNRIRKLVPYLVAHGARDADPAGFGERFQASCDIDAVAEDVVVLSDDVAEVDADTKPDAALVGHCRFAIDH